MICVSRTILFSFGPVHSVSSHVIAISLCIILNSVTFALLFSFHESYLCFYTLWRKLIFNILKQERPEFREIIPILEECRQSQAVAMLSNIDPPPSIFPSALPMVTVQDSNTDGRTTPPLVVGHVSALRNHWEMEASRNRLVFDGVYRIVKLNCIQ